MLAGSCLLPVCYPETELGCAFVLRSLLDAWD